MFGGKKYLRQNNVDLNNSEVRLSVIFKIAELEQNYRDGNIDFECLQRNRKAIRLSFYEVIFSTICWLNLYSKSFDRIMGHIQTEGDRVVNPEQICAREILCRYTKTWGYDYENQSIMFEAWRNDEPIITFRKNLPKIFREKVQVELGKLHSERDLNKLNGVELDSDGEPLEFTYLAFNKGVTYEGWKPRPPYEEWVKQFSEHPRRVERFIDENFEITPPLKIAYQSYYNRDMSSNRAYLILKRECAASFDSNVLSTSFEVVLELFDWLKEPSKYSAFYFSLLLKLENTARANGVWNRFKDRILILKSSVLRYGDSRYLSDEDKEIFEREKPIL